MGVIHYPGRHPKSYPIQGIHGGEWCAVMKIAQVRVQRWWNDGMYQNL